MPYLVFLLLLILDVIESSTAQYQSDDINPASCKEFWTTNFVKCDNSKGHEECLSNAIEDAVVKLKDGNSKLKIPPLDPLEQFSSINLLCKNGTTHVKVVLNSTVLEGLVNSKVQNVSFSDNADTEFGIKIPEVVVRGMYMVADRTDPDLLTPATSCGNFTLTAINVTMVFKVKSGGIVLKSIDKEWGTVQLSSDGNENLLRRNEEEGFHVIVKMGVGDLATLLAERDYMDVIIEFLIGGPVGRYAEGVSLKVPAELLP